MFLNCAGKLKTFAKVEFGICVFCSIIIFIGGIGYAIAIGRAMYGHGSSLGIIMMIYFWFLAAIIFILGWFGSLKLYAFAELVESNQQMFYIMQQQNFRQMNFNQNDQQQYQQVNTYQQ